MVLHLGQVTPHARADIGVGRGCRGALELAVFLRQLMAGGDEKLRVGSRDQRLCPPLMLGRAVGMQEQDRDRLDPLCDEGGCRLADLVVVERQQDTPARIDPLANLATQRTGDQGHMLLEEKIVQFPAG